MSKSHVTKISLLTFIALLASLSLLVVSDIDTAEGADVGTTFEQDDPVGSRLWEVPIIRVGLEGTTFEHDGLSYEVTGANTVSVISGSGIGDLSIPSSISYDSEIYQVTAIGDRAFRDCTGLTSVTIPDSVTSIGDSAFYGLTFYSKDGEAVLDHTAHDLSGHHFIGTNAEMMINAEIIKSDNTDRSFATEAIAGVIIVVLVTVLIAVWVQKRKGRL